MVLVLKWFGTGVVMVWYWFVTGVEMVWYDLYWLHFDPILVVLSKIAYVMLHNLYIWCIHLSIDSFSLCWILIALIKVNRAN